jgi:hypothetical protein
MDRHPIDGIARTLGTQDRRSSLKALALGIAAVGAAPRVAGAKSKAGKKAKKQCKKQVAPCVSQLQALCDPANTDCLNNAVECCGFLGTCNANAAIDCIIGAFII